MEDIEDIKKLKVFLKTEKDEQNIQQELSSFIEPDSDEEESSDENYLEEVEEDLQENERYFNTTTNYSEETNNQVCDVREQELIENCKDAAVKRLMILNRAKNKSIKDLADKLYALLMTCRKRIFEESQAMKERMPYRQFSRSYSWRLGYPYFKDKNNFPAPPNADVIRKQQNSELFISHLPPQRKWTTQEQSLLRGGVLFGYFKYHQKQSEQNLRLLKIKVKSAVGKEKEYLEREIANLENEVKQLYLKGSCDPPPLGCNSGIDWETIAIEDLRGKHSANECLAFWSIYLHPSINKNNWLKEEDSKLKKIVVKYNYQDWDKIAKVLGTNRSGFTVFLHYYSVLNERFKKARFEPKEDSYLLQVIESCRVGSYIPWGRVSYFFQNRSRTQLYHRYRYFLQKEDIKKGTFTEAEDVLLRLLVYKFGKNFARCVKYIPHRTAVQIRNRYQSYLDKTLNFCNYTLEDDLKILQYVSDHGTKNWRPLSESLKRTRAQVRQRYWSLIKWYKNNPEKNLAEFPRRNLTIHKIKSKESAFVNLVFENFKDLDGIPSLEEIERCLDEKRIQKNALLSRRGRSKMHLDIVDIQLREFFKTSHKLKPTNKTTSESWIKQTAMSINTILSILDANLTLTEENFARKKLDSIDKKVLVELMNEKNKNLSSDPIPGTSQDRTLTNFSKTKDIPVLPPNISTLIGLRNLVIKHHFYKEQLNQSKNLSKELNQQLYKPVENRIREELACLDPQNREKVLKGRQLFIKRFYSLFKWPAIMSNCEPKYHLNSFHFPNDREKEEGRMGKDGSQALSKRGRGRPRKTYPNPKIEKMNQVRKELRLMKGISNSSVKSEHVFNLLYVNNTNTSESGTSTGDDKQSNETKRKVAPSYSYRSYSNKKLKSSLEKNQLPATEKVFIKEEVGITDLLETRGNSSWEENYSEDITDLQKLNEVINEERRRKQCVNESHSNYAESSVHSELSSTNCITITFNIKDNEFYNLQEARTLRNDILLLESVIKKEKHS